ncbi:DNA topoisomerase IV subunit B, partial [Rhizobium ruizarguesonis]
LTFSVLPSKISRLTVKVSGHGSMEWAINWYGGDPQVHSYCNTIPKTEGGTHEAGLRIALTKGLKDYAELTQNKRAAQITTDDVMISAVG